MTTSSQTPTPKKRVLILSYADWEGLARMPGMLHQATCEVSVFCRQHTYLSLSRFVQHCFSQPAGIGLSEFVEQVGLHLQHHDYDWILPGDDPLLYELAKRADQDSWAKAILAGVIDTQRLAFATSKSQFYLDASRHGLSMPESLLCQNQSDLLAAAQTLGYPLVLKETQGFAGLAVCIVRNPAELQNYRLTQAVLAQRYIDGQLLSVAAVYQAGQLLAYFSYYRSRTWGKLGPSAAIRFQEFQGMTEILQKLGQLSGFSGQCGIDLIQDQRSGEIYLLEQNFRPTLTADLGPLAGVDLALALAEMLGLRHHQQMQQPDPNCQRERPLFPQDLLRALDERDWLGSLRWLCLPHYWRYCRWQEPKILRRNLRIVAAKLLKADNLA